MYNKYNKFGLRSNEKIDQIISKACDYVRKTRGTFEKKMLTKKMDKMKKRYDKEMEKIGAVDECTFKEALNVTLMLDCNFY